MTVPRDNAYDVIIVGSGAAGLAAALKLAPYRRVAVLSKGAVTEGSTLYAQGGIAAVLDAGDSLASHIADTIDAGAGLCDPGIVDFVVTHGREVIEWLTGLGVTFTRGSPATEFELEEGWTGRAPGGPIENAPYHLTQEGGHSHRRIVHAADATGHAVETTLAACARAEPNVTIIEGQIAVNLIVEQPGGGSRRPRCRGLYVFDIEGRRVNVFRAREVVLATGGASKVYLYTSNPDSSSGDGIAMAWRAGCRVANMEFNQFHPTCLYHPHAGSFLITEAVRGEGGKLKLPDGSAFMARYDSRAELAPRDIVARAIDQEMKRHGIDCVYLDISHKPESFVETHFPTVRAKCLEFGYDLAKEPIPVVPAAHYTCGGIMTDRRGRTDIENLYAIGETAYTGLHGANRMASNSLLECFVMGSSAAADIIETIETAPMPPPLAPWDESRVTDSDEEVVVSHNWHELRRFMWDYVGIVRTDKRLRRAKNRIDLLQKEIDEYYGNFRVSNDLLELRNLATVADLIIRSAMLRKESRGLHFTEDYPARDESREPAPTILTPPGHPATEPEATSERHSRPRATALRG